MEVYLERSGTWKGLEEGGKAALPPTLPTLGSDLGRTTSFPLPGIPP